MPACIQCKHVNDFCRIAGGDSVGGDGVGDDRAGTYGAVIADGDTGKNRDITAYPDVVSDGDRFSPFFACGAFGRVGAMTGRVDMYTRANETVVANGDKSFV